MKNNKYKFAKIIVFLLSFFAFTAFVAHAQVATQDDDGNFNPENIISDDEILDDRAMTLDEIQRFLEQKGGFLANYVGLDANGEMKKASEMIFNAATNNYDCDSAENISDNPTINEKKEKCQKITINPRFLIVLLQKEMSLIEETSPTSRQLDWAVGYGCPDGAACGERWRGFGKQVNSAALQFFDYMVHPNRYTYKAGATYVFNNPYSTTVQGTMTVTPANQATAALYNYTPHVYNGNYNFYKIWQRYFTRGYPDGTLLQSREDGGVWLLQAGKKRPFASKGALTSRYDIKKIITVAAADLNKYPTGPKIKFGQYQLVRLPSGGTFLLIDNKKMPIKTKLVFKKLGFNPEEVVDASEADLSDYILGNALTATSTYVFGQLAQDKKTGGVFLLQDNTKAPLWDKVLLKTKFKNRRIVKMTTKELNKFTTIEPVKYGDGELVKTTAGTGVYIISNGEKHPFDSGDTFETLGYRWSNVIEISPKLMSLYALASPITLPKVTPANLATASSTDLALGTSTPTLIGTSTISTTTVLNASTTPLSTSSLIMSGKK